MGKAKNEPRLSSWLVVATSSWGCLHPAFGWPHPRMPAVGCTRHCWAAHACVWLPASLGCGCLRLAVHIVVGLCTPAIGCPRRRWAAYTCSRLPTSSLGSLRLHLATRVVVWLRTPAVGYPRRRLATRVVVGLPTPALGCLRRRGASRVLVSWRQCVKDGGRL